MAGTLIFLALAGTCAAVFARHIVLMRRYGVRSTGGGHFESGMAGGDGGGACGGHGSHCS